MKPNSSWRIRLTQILLGSAIAPRGTLARPGRMAMAPCARESEALAFGTKVAEEGGQIT